MNRRSVAAFLSSLRVRLVLLVLLAVIPALLLILYTAAEQRQRATAQVQADAMRLTRLVAAQQASYIQEARMLLIALARLPEVQKLDPATCNPLFASMLRQYPYYANLGAAQSTGEMVCSAELATGTLSIADRSNFIRAMQTRDFSVGEYQIGRITGKAGISFSYPILDEAGKLNGVVVLSLDLAWLNKFVTEAQLPPGASLRVIDQNGIILARYPDPEKWIGQAVPETSLLKTMLLHGQGVTSAIGVDGVVRLYAFLPLISGPGNSVYLSIGIPVALAYADADAILTRNLQAMGLVAILALAAAWIVGDLSIARRVDALLDVAKQLAEGDLRARTHIRHGMGELGQLSHTFDQMAEMLERRDRERRQAEERTACEAAVAQTLARTAGRLNAQLDLSQVLKTVCEESVRALEVPASKVLLYDETRGVLYRAADLGLPPELGQLWRDIPREVYDQYSGLTAMASVLEDVKKIPGMPNADLIQRLDMRTVASASMVREGRLVGVLCLFTLGQTRGFTQDELMLLKGLADQAALAITNARLLVRAEEEARARADLFRQATSAQEAERLRIARELHDETSQCLSTLILSLDRASHNLAGDGHRASQNLDTAKLIAQEMLDDIHRLIEDLRPMHLDLLGLAAAIRWYGEERLGPLGITLNLETDGLGERLPASLETVLFRIVQEGVTNVIRHAQASVVSIRLAREDGTCQLEVADDGKGFDPSESHGKGLGLRGMRERVRIVGGELRVDSEPGRGTVVHVRVPVPIAEVTSEQNPGLSG